VSQRSFLQCLTREEVYSPSADAVGHRFRTAVSQAELEDRERPVRITASPLTAPTTRHRGRRHDASECSQLRRARRAPGRRALQPLLGSLVVTPLFGVECRSSPTNWPTRKRHRHRDDLHVRRYDDVVWWRELNLPTRALIDATADSLRPTSPTRACPCATPNWPRVLRPRRAGKTVNQAPRDDRRRSALDRGTDRRGPRDHAPRKFYEKVSASARDRDVAPVVRAHARRRDELLARGEELHWHPDYMRHATARGRRTQRRLEHLATTVLRRAFPRGTRDDNGEINFDT